MDADLDTLCIAVYCTADDLLPSRPANARRPVTDAVLVTLCVAQAIMGIPSDRRFLALAQRQLRALFPHRPGQSGYHKRRRRLAKTIEWLMGVFAKRSPGFEDPLLLAGSTPVECARSAARRSNARRRAMTPTTATAPAAAVTSGDSGLTPSSPPTARLRALALRSPKRDEREVGLKLLARTRRAGGEILLERQGRCRA